METHGGLVQIIFLSLRLANQKIKKKSVGIHQVATFLRCWFLTFRIPWVRRLQGRKRPFCFSCNLRCLLPLRKVNECPKKHGKEKHYHPQKIQPSYWALCISLMGETWRSNMENLEGHVVQSLKKSGFKFTSRGVAGVHVLHRGVLVQFCWAKIWKPAWKLLGNWA